MATTLANIRTLIERETKYQVEDADVIMWANQVNADIGTSINIQSTAQIALNTVDIEYTEPVNLKIINRLWLQSERDNDIDREFTGSYRRYNGKLIFARPFSSADTLNVDFYKHMNYFTSTIDTIELDDRYAPLYASYGVMKYYRLPAVSARMNEAQARQEWQLAQAMYENVKRQVISLYALDSDPVVIDERW